MKKVVMQIIDEVKETKINSFQEIEGGTASENAKNDMLKRAAEIIGKAQMILDFMDNDENLEATLERVFGKDYVSEIKFLSKGYLDSVLEAYIPNAAERQVVWEARKIGAKIVTDRNQHLNFASKDWWL